MCKALAAGADSIMVGRLVAGCEESPGVAFNKDGKFIKIYRGMAGCNIFFNFSGGKFSKAIKNRRIEFEPTDLQLRRSRGIYPIHRTSSVCDSRICKWDQEWNELLRSI